MTPPASQTAAPPTFSVITANYNSGDKLAATMASVLEQAVDAEHVIFDGGSTDSSLALARQGAADHPGRIRVTSERDRGIYDAMNKGIRAAAGRYLYFMGAGDVLRPGVLQDIKKHLAGHELAMVYGNVWYYGREYDGPFHWRKLAYANVCHQSAFYGRDVFPLLGDYDLKYKFLADWEFNLRCFGNAKVEKRFVPILVGDFEPGGASQGGDPQFFADRLMLLRRNFGPARMAYLRGRELATSAWRLVRPLKGGTQR